MITVRGYTLIELLLIISLLGILFTLSISFYSSLKFQHQLEIQVTQLINDIQFMRNSALSLQKQVNLCPSDDGETCVSSSLKGWIIFVQSHKENETINNIIRHYNLATNSQILWQGMGNQTYLQINQLGDALGHNGTFTIIINNNNIHLTRTIIISPTGRVRLALKD